MALMFWGVFLQQAAISSAVTVKEGSVPLGGNLIVFVLFALAHLTAPVVAQVSGSPTLIVQKEEDAEGSPTTTEFFLSTAGALTNETHNPENENVSTEEMTTVTEVGTSFVELTNTPGTTSQLPSVDQEKTTDAEMNEYHDNLFYYDYYSLRKWGLVAAAILFILGILILTCGKHGKFPRCRGKKRGRAYNVSLA
ncbi:FXYD domain-containing ion transport regulator 5 isoform X2 [Python bivittatus]|uniref:FXYD domain-containing ion transport regulator n=1 Tax=Python bivittatus TaxID=176946 RepID=A0A9F5JET0_PYTBI|nr:FXYD domain-containing ion transport regulator 5 isoform X2 [Python bivittatus]